MKTNTKRLLSILLTMAMLLSFIPAITLTAAADDAAVGTESAQFRQDETGLLPIGRTLPVVVKARRPGPTGILPLGLCRQIERKSRLRAKPREEASIVHDVP